MKSESNKTFRIFFIAFAAVFLSVALFSTYARAEDYGNAMTRKKRGIDPSPHMTDEEILKMQEEAKSKMPKNLQFDPSMKIFLSAKKTTYEPGEQPVVEVYLKNDSKETRYFKQIWSPAGVEGVFFRTFVNGQETWGSRMFYRESVKPESSNPADAFRLDPGEKKKVLSLIFNELFPGEITLSTEYITSFTVNEPSPRNWWQGLAKSNEMTLKVERILPGKELTASMNEIVDKIHADIMKLKSKNKDISEYGDSALSTPKGSFRNAKSIEFVTLLPERREIRIYFNEPDYAPGTMPMFDETFPYLGIKFFAHIDVGGNTALRNALLSSIKKNIPILYDKTKDYAANIKVTLEPFSADTSKKLRRAAYIVRGAVKSKNVETSQPYEYEIRKWVINVAVKKTYLGKISDKEIVVKSGAINTLFGEEDPIGKEYILLFSDKNNWQKEYTLIGVEPVHESLLSWLSQKYK